MGKFTDLTGQRFGRLTVIERAENHIQPNEARVTMWRCLCDCGNIKAVRGGNLKSGHAKSCGCLNRELAAMRATERETTHGGSYTRMYRIYRNMKERCYNPKHKSYKQYGGRGICVCPEWATFKTFQEWAFSNGYRDGLSIDRIDVNGNYSPENCRWATAKEQSRNTRRNRHITINGEIKTLVEWCEQYGISANVVRGRLRQGWSIEKALNTPVGKKKTE